MHETSAQAAGAEELLLRTLGDPSSARQWCDEQWDTLVRVARASGLLGILHARLDRSAAMQAIPQAVRGQLYSASILAKYRRQMAYAELDRLARALAPLHVPIVLLKGAAYLVQDLACAQGRSLADVDILVPRARLAEVERALLAQGWEATPLAPYDEAYYRNWSHELPPFRYCGAALELDIHHTILPPRGRIRLDTAALLRDATTTAQRGFKVLAAEDQVLHASLHLLQDSDCTNRLRDLVDIDSLLREFGRDPGFWNRLVARARQHGAGRPLWYTLRYAQRFLRTDIPAEVWTALQSSAPHAAIAALMDNLVGRVLMPPHPDAGYSRAARIASLALLARALWLRFPAHLVVAHSFAKLGRWVAAGVVKPKTV